MTIVPGWHPIVVHFPLALVVTGAGFLLAAKFARSDRIGRTLATVGTWNLCIGTAAAFLALATGLAAVLDLHVGTAAHHAITAHLKWAISSTCALLLVSVWRGAGNAADSRPSWLLIVVMLAATAALIVTGYRGGQNVYGFGIGVSVPAEK